MSCEPCCRCASRAGPRWARAASIWKGQQTQPALPQPLPVPLQCIASLMPLQLGGDSRSSNAAILWPIRDVIVQRTESIRAGRSDAVACFPAHRGPYNFRCMGPGAASGTGSSHPHSAVELGDLTQGVRDGELCEKWRAACTQARRSDAGARACQPRVREQHGVPELHLGQEADIHAEPNGTRRPHRSCDRQEAHEGALP